MYKSRMKNKQKTEKKTRERGTEEVRYLRTWHVSRKRKKKKREITDDCIEKD